MYSIINIEDLEEIDTHWKSFLEKNEIKIKDFLNMKSRVAVFYKKKALDRLLKINALFYYIVRANIAYGNNNYIANLKNKFTLFLDIDGVMWNHHNFLNEKDGQQGFFKHSVNALNFLCKLYPNIDIVISSTWRLGRTIDDLQKLFLNRGFLFSNKITGKTEKHTHPYSFRGNEIYEYTKENNIKKYFILDDDNDMLLWQKSNYIKIKNSLNMFHSFLIIIKNIMYKEI